MIGRGETLETRGPRFCRLRSASGCSVEELARIVIDAAVAKTRSTVEGLATDYGLDLKAMVLVGGGGGAAALVPALANALGCEFRIARNAHVISPIGVALALVRDVVERMIPNPTAEDIALLRAEAEDAAVAAGAARESVEVDVSVDSQRNIVRAAASGATELRTRDLRRDRSRRRRAPYVAAESMRAAPESLLLAASTPQFSVYTTRVKPSGLLRYFGSVKDPVRVVDREGVIRLRVPHARIVPTTIAQAEDELRDILDTLTSYGDAGKMLPALHLLLRDRIVNLSGMVDPELVVTIASDHLRALAAQRAGRHRRRASSVNARALAKRLGARIVERRGGISEDRWVMSECNPRDKTIVLYLDTLELLSEFVIISDLPFDPEHLDEIAIAHECFHMISGSTHGPQGEEDAHKFARELLDLPASPELLNELLSRQSGKQ